VDWLKPQNISNDLCHKITLIENSENVGFGRANNQAIREASTPMLLLLNNDAEVTEGAIDALLATIDSDPRIGACGPRLVNSDGSLQVSAWRNPPAPWDILVRGLRLFYLIPRRTRGELLLGKFWDHSHRRDVGMLSAAALLVKRPVINEVGGFDERFHMYAEDDEWCLRATRAGWRLVFEPAAVVIHHGSKSAAVRWDTLEHSLRVLTEGLRFQRYSLSRVHFVSNVLANTFVVALAHCWRRIRGIPSIETRMKLGIYAKTLMESFRGN